MRPFIPALLLAVACGKGDATTYLARGTVEMPESDLSAPQAARVIALRVDEGSPVHRGDTLALLTQTDLPASLAAAQSRVATAEANLRDLQAGARPQEIRQAEAEVSAAEAEAERSRQLLDRAKALVASNAIARQQYDDAVAADRVAAQRLEEAKEALALAKAGARPQRVEAARSEVSTARAALAQLQARATDLVLSAPFDGIVLGRHAEPGEALGPNVPVLTVAETARPYVRVFVPQAIVSGLALGAPVDIVISPDRIIKGKIEAINPKAEFTPRVALTEQERADLMFGVKVAFANPTEAPHAGLWVSVRIPGAGNRESGVGSRE
jgi:HlyD family secretion protein